MQRVIPPLRSVSRLFLTGLRPPYTRKRLRINPLLHFTNSFSVTRMANEYGTLEKGRLNTEDYRMYITTAKDGQIVSPFHDIPLYYEKGSHVFNMVVEIPRWTNHKMEISKEEVMNPIKQDVKKGKVRFVKNCFPHHGYIWNYGALPQTWEDVDHEDELTNTKGDNDPVDVCEIGQKVHKRGSVIQVKILGAMCLVDEGETDWKILCIDVNDPLAVDMNDIEDVAKNFPGLIEATQEWFKIYKIPDGKPQNNFGYDGAKNKDFAIEVIEQTHKQWTRLMGTEKDVNRGDIALENVTVTKSDKLIDQSKAKEYVEKSSPVGDPEELPEDVDKWWYVSNL